MGQLVTTPAVAVASVRTGLNPRSPSRTTLHGDPLTAYIVTNEHGRLKVLLHRGPMGRSWAVGAGHRLVSAQTNIPLGLHRVIGIIDLVTRECEGEVPNRFLSQWTIQ